MRQKYALVPFKNVVLAKAPTLDEPERTKLRKSIVNFYGKDVKAVIFTEADSLIELLLITGTGFMNTAADGFMYNELLEKIEVSRQIYPG